MTVSFVVHWWYLPVAIAAVGTLFLPTGPGGAVITGACYLAAISIVIGHFL